MGFGAFGRIFNMQKCHCCSRFLNLEKDTVSKFTIIVNNVTEKKKKKKKVEEKEDTLSA